MEFYWMGWNESHLEEGKRIMQYININFVNLCKFMMIKSLSKLIFNSEVLSY